ncbi:DgyrCDS11035 [Dimorphilus gyrociliatus]|uniref:protein-tyrosine-phosphatase n=1 Tax=Dimorphilus gyrociliatus TaxID=2664684 RepID=A0A7I8W365_9ANNE|nr:DgyrCDS11035 [Dimorphilus gyrociliatus]
MKMLPCIASESESQGCNDYNAVALCDSNKELTIRSDNDQTRKLKVCLSIPLFKPYVQLTRRKGGIKEFKYQKKDFCVEKCGNPILSPTTPPEEQNVDIELAPVAEVLPFLYIGNERDASDRCTIDSFGITHILNCTSHLPEHFSSCGIIYQRLPANDSSQQDLKQYFEEAFEFIGKYIKNVL